VSIYRVNNRHPVVNSIENMAGYYKIMVVEMDVPVEVMEDKESIKEESSAPEGKWNPGIQIIVIPGRRIVSYNRGTIIVVIVVDYLTRSSGFLNFTCRLWRTARLNV